jgi:hypothetical protein
MLAVLALAALVVACNDQPAAPTNDALTPQASVAQRGYVHMPNSPVWRYADRYWSREEIVMSGHDWQLVYYDAPVVHPSCNGGAWGGEPPLWQTMFAVTQNDPLNLDTDPIVPGDEVKIIFSAQANDLPLVIYDNTTWLAMRAQYGPLSPEFCNYLRTGYLYRGTVELRQGDNNYTGGGTGMDVFGLHMWGLVRDLAGSGYNFDWRTRYQFELPDYFKVVRQDMVVRPTGR